MKVENLRVAWFSYNKEEDAFEIKVGFAFGVRLLTQENEYEKGVSLLIDFDCINDKSTLGFYKNVQNPFKEEKPKEFLHYQILKDIHNLIFNHNVLFLGQLDNE